MFFFVYQNRRQNKISIPDILSLCFSGILESLPPGSLELQQAKQDIYQYELLSLLLISLKQDFTKMPAGWATAAKLTYLLRFVLVLQYLIINYHTNYL